MARKEINANAEEVVTPEVLSEMQDNDAAPESMALTTALGSLALGTVQGELTASDVRLPRLSIAYGVGGLAENFNPGDLVLAGENLLVKKGEPLTVILVAVTQYWKQYLSSEQYNSGVRPASYLTEAEVMANGGTTKWVNNVGPTFNRAMNLKMLIAKPKDVICGLFGIPVGDTEYAPAVMDVDKTAYKRIGPTVLGAASFSLKTRGLLSGKFELSTRSEKVNGNAIIVPTIKLSGHNTDEEIKQILSAFGQ
jgi:hypothetical protein